MWFIPAACLAADDNAPSSLSVVERKKRETEEHEDIELDDPEDNFATNTQVEPVGLVASARAR